MPTPNHTASPEPLAPCGRFAPSPSGHLHFGSLVAALASYLHVKSRGGRWLLRIDDIDQPRVVHSTIPAIQRCLSDHGLHWDGEVLCQSTRESLYRDALATLAPRTYRCRCSRKKIAAVANRGPVGLIYPGTCDGLALREQSGATAVRLRISDGELSLNDQFQGTVTLNLQRCVGDFLLRRADGVFSYHLTAAVDDTEDGITEVIRGADLLFSSHCQIYLQGLLGRAPPAYGHVPVAVTAGSLKLSKQSGAAPLSSALAPRNLIHALQFLAQEPPPGLEDASVMEILVWGAAHWSAGKIPRQRKQTVSENHV